MDPSPLDLFRLDDKVVLVTGASAGLGERFARVVAGVGAKVVVTARRADRLAALLDHLPDAHAIAADLGAPGQATRVVSEALDRYGRIDVVVNNAGISRIIPAIEDDIDAFRHEIEIDLVAPYEIARHAARHMIDNGYPGSIVNIGSIAGAVAGGRMRYPGYAAAKGGLHNLTRELASQWARKGIRVNCIAPAWFETEMTSQAMFNDESGVRFVENGTPMGRPGRDGELDGALLYLASDASSYVTGHILFVDGGWTAI